MKGYGLGKTYTVRDTLTDEEQKAVKRLKNELDNFGADLSRMGYLLSDMFSVRVQCPFGSVKDYMSEFIESDKALSGLWKSFDRVKKEAAEAEKLLDTQYAEYGPAVEKIRGGLFGNKVEKIRRKYALELQAIAPYELLGGINKVEMHLGAAENHIHDVEDNDAMYMTTVRALDWAAGLSKGYLALDEALVSASGTFDPSIWNEEPPSKPAPLKRMVSWPRDSV